MTKRTRTILVVLLAGWVLPLPASAQPPLEYSGGAVKAILGKSQTNTFTPHQHQAGSIFPAAPSV